MTDPFARHLAAELEAERELRLKSERRIGELMAEVERLRDLLGRLEWAVPCDGGRPGCGECPVCWRHKAADHDPGCWLAAEINRES